MRKLMDHDASVLGATAVRIRDTAVMAPQRHTIGLHTIFLLNNTEEMEETIATNTAMLIIVGRGMNKEGLVKEIFRAPTVVEAIPTVIDVDFTTVNHCHMESGRLTDLQGVVNRTVE